jgi:hypothetical protein
MSFSFYVNQSPATGAEAVLSFKAGLKLNGWTVPMSSDGLTLNGSGDQISQAGSGANGMANNSAWFVVQQPSGGSAPQAGSRQYLLQRSATDNRQWRIKYSFGGLFTGGSATVAPTATDEQILLGTGNAAASGYTNWFSTDGTYRVNTVVDNASPFGFWFATWLSGSGVASATLMMDPLAAGSFSVGELDPYLIYMGTSADSQAPYTAAHLCSEVYGPRGYIRKGLQNEIFGAVPGVAYFSSSDTGGSFRQTAPGFCGTDHITAKENLLPLLYIRRTANNSPPAQGGGYKGISSFMRWVPSVRATGDAMTISSPGDRIVIEAVTLPWNGTTVLI